MFNAKECYGSSKPYDDEHSLVITSQKTQVIAWWLIFVPSLGQLWAKFASRLGHLGTVLVQYGLNCEQLMNYLSAHLHQCWSNIVTQPWMGLVTNAPFGCQSWSNIVNQPWDICPKTVLYQGCYPVLGRFGKQHWTNIDPNINVSWETSYLNNPQFRVMYTIAFLKVRAFQLSKRHVSTIHNLELCTPSHSSKYELFNCPNVISQQSTIQSYVHHRTPQSTSFSIVQTSYIYLQNYPNSGTECLYYAMWCMKVNKWRFFRCGVIPIIELYDANTTLSS